ncbi:MAG: ATPase [Bacteroidales bacterium]|nr:ATPase [Bacteroidales bacterium]
MEPIVIAYIGVGLTLAFSGIGSILGVSACGNATVGAVKKNPGGFGECLILSAIPSTQGLYGFIGFFLMQGKLAADMGMLPAIAIFSAGLTLGLLCFYSAIRQASVASNGIAAIGAGHKVFANTLIVAVFAELYPIIGLLVVVLTMGVI